MRGRMLLVAHDPALRERLARLFQGAGHAVEVAESVTQARRVNFRGLARAVVIPEGLGDEARVLTRELQAVTKLLLVTATSLNQDFATLNVSDEASLLAWTSEGLPSQSENSDEILQFSDYRFDLDGHTLIGPAEREIFLTPGEFRLLKAFVQRPGRVLPRDELLTATTGRDADTFDRSVDVLVMRLRRKIEPDPRRPSLIVTIPGTGYKFAPRVTRANIRAQIGSPEDSAAAASTPSRPAERRHLTVLQCSLSGPTFLAAQHDPEDLTTLLAAIHEQCAQIIAEAGGSVAGRLSDGILAYFGYPQADEHQAERAVRAGFKLIEAGRSSRLDMRIGIASGLVVVDGPAKPSDEPTVLGRAVATAGRLCFRSDPNSMVVADTTRRLIGGLFYCRLREPPVPESTAEPRQTWTVEEIVVSESRFESIHGAELSPFIGREAERALLTERWALARMGEGQAVLLCGEPGIGKSRILKEFLDHLQAGPVEIMRLQCSPHAIDSAYYPIIDNLQRVLKFTPDEAQEVRLDRLEALLVGRYGRPSGDLRFIASILALPCEQRYGALPVMPQKVKDETLRTLADTVEAAARSQPTAMLVEDIHWADPTTLEVIDHLLDRLSHLPLLLVMTHRPELQSRWPHRDNLTTVTLPRLTRQQSVRLVSGVSRERPLPSDLLEQILLKTDGVPLFLEEVTKAALEVVEGQVDADRDSGTGAATALPMPLTLYDSLAARLDRQGPAAKEVAQTGAAIGREFGYGLLASTIDLPEPQLHEALDRLINAGLVLVRGMPPQSGYIFKHALVQDAAYGTLLRSRRQRLHSRIAATLEDHFPEIVSAQPSLLARHCATAGLAEKAVDYWLKAGQQSLMRSAMAEAIAQLRKGLEMLGGLSDGPWRQQQELDLRFLLTRALMPAIGLSAAEVDENLARARVLAEQLNRADHLVPLIAHQWMFRHGRSEHRLALALSEQIEQIGASRNDAKVQSIGHYTQGMTRYHLGEFVAARALLQQGLDHADLTLWRLAGVATLGCLAMTLAHLGYIDQARSRMDEALSEARRHGYALTLRWVHALLYAAMLDSLTRSPAVHLEEFLAKSTEQDFPFYLGYALAFRGRSLVAVGQAQEGLALLMQGLAKLRPTGAVTGMPRLLTWLAEAHASLGQPETARNYLAEAVRIIEITGERFARLNGGIGCRAIC